MSEQQAEFIAVAMQKLSEEFDELMQKRHEQGAKEYGVFTFLENDVIRMLAEELADACNYMRMIYIKVMLLQAFLEEELRDKADPEGNITIGVESFKGTGAGWKK